MTAYMLKSVREAKLHTSWLTPNQPYEEALTAFVERILGRAQEGDERPTERLREEGAEGGADEREQKALGQQLPEHPRA